MKTTLAKNTLSRLCGPVLVVAVLVKALAFFGVALPSAAHAGATSSPTDAPPAQFKLVATVPLQSNARGGVTVNRALNKIYVSGNPLDNVDIEVNVIDGASLLPPTDVGYGDGTSVDIKSNRYWSTTIFRGSVIIRNGTTDSTITTIPIPSGCPIGANYDFFNRRMWVGTQCGGFHDSIFVYDAKTFAFIHGPIDSGGVLSGDLIANGANGRFYCSAQPGGVGDYISERVDPTTFTVTANAFGRVLAINALTNTLYAVPDTSNDLQIIDGKPDPEVILKTVTLSYHPSSMGINTALNHLYLANKDAQSIEVRDPAKGKLIATFSLSGLGLTPDLSMAVDSLRSRIYIIQNSPAMLLVIEDLITAFGPDCILSH